MLKLPFSTWTRSADGKFPRGGGPQLQSRHPGKQMLKQGPAPRPGRSQPRAVACPPHGLPAGFLPSRTHPISPPPTPGNPNPIGLRDALGERQGGLAGGRGSLRAAERLPGPFGGPLHCASGALRSCAERGGYCSNGLTADSTSVQGFSSVWGNKPYVKSSSPE